MMSSSRISENFTAAKLLSILLVATGHYFEGTLLWVPVTIGLFIFAYSSAYFTAQKHAVNGTGRAFWRNKLARLGPPLIVINLFLLLLFLIQGKEGLATFHTALGLVGLSGLLDWLGIANQSPYGAGLWFFTLLLIFYLLYPLLARACANRSGRLAFIGTAFVLCTLGHFYASPAHMLWPTAFGFCFGVFAGRGGWAPSPYPSLAAAAVLFSGLVGLNLAGINQFNYFLLVGSSIATIAVLSSVPFGFLQSRPVLLFAPCVLEIYFIHTYLFVRPPSMPPAAGYLISMALVLSTSLVLHALSSRLARWRMFSTTARPSTQDAART